MTCEEFGRMLDNYESLSDSEKLALNAHASECEQCRDELDFLLAIITQLNTLPEVQPSADFAAKLNERLDAEKPSIGGFGRAFASIRRNYRQYSTVAACIALAVVIGANGKTLFNRMSPDTDAVPSVTSTNRPALPTPIAAEIAAAVPQMQDTTPAEDSASVTGSSVIASADGAETRSKNKVSGGNISFIRNMSESINQIDLNAVPKQTEPAYNTENSGVTASAGARSAADENAGIAVASLENDGIEAYSDEVNNKRNYTIARGVYRLPDENIADAEARKKTAAAKNEVLQISEIEGRGERSIARGRYYIPADEGNISINTGNEIGVNSDDAERAEELIQQYADQVEESYYVINSENIPSMLEHMEGEGINYQSNVDNADHEKVSFKLVIE